MQPLTVASLTLTPFSFPLKHPFTIAGAPVTERSGLYVTLNFSDGSSARGEIAPLPGVSLETLPKAQHDAQAAAAVLKGWSLAYGLGDLLAQIKAEARFMALCPSVRFGIESALLEKGGFLKDVPAKVESAGLLQGNYEQVMAQAQALKAQGVKTFKLKVGDRNIPLDVKKAKDVRALMGPQGLLRLDANRSWAFEEAALFAQLVTAERIEFIEEPLKDMARVGEFYTVTRMPVALDETLATARCGVEAPGRCSPTLAKQEGVKAYVIKPMILGGVSVALDWMAEAGRNGKQSIISSSFETPVGMRMLKVLAKRSGQVAGLGTEAWLS